MKGRPRPIPVASTALGHILLGLIFAAGIALRVLATIAYQPALLLQRDAYAYLNQATGAGGGGGFRPAVYPLFLKVLLIGHNLLVVPIVQHIIGLGIAALIFILLRRGGVSPVFAALGTAPILLDAYQVDIEQYVLTETLFEMLIVSALALLVWHPRPSTGQVIVAGLLLMLAALTRYAGLVLIIPALVFLFVRRAGGRKLMALTLSFALPYVAYSLLGPSVSSGGPGGKIGFFLYGRVLPFADCSSEPADVPHALCSAPPSDSGFFSIKDRLGSFVHEPDANGTLLRFALAQIRDHPLDYLGTVASDVGRYFDLTAPPEEETPAKRWLFVRNVGESDPLPYIAARGGSPPDAVSSQTFAIRQGPAHILATYQRYAYTSGPLVGLLLLVGIVGSLIAGGPTARLAGLFAASGACVLVFPLLVTVYHVRYDLPALPLIGAAGAAGAWLAFERSRGTPEAASTSG